MATVPKFKLKMKTKTDVDKPKIPSKKLMIAGTRLITEEGFKYIDKVQGGDTVLTYKGNFKKVIDTREEENGSDWILIMTSGRYTPIICTSDQTFYAIDDREPNSPPKWVRADQMTESHRLGLPINKNREVTGYSFTRLEYPKPNDTNIPIDPNKPIDQDIFGKPTERQTEIDLSDPNYWYVMGHYAGYCSFTEIGSIIGPNIDDEKDDKKIKDVFDHFREVDREQEWCVILKKFGDGFRNKTIPEWVHNAPKKYIYEFVTGCDTPIMRNYDMAMNMQRLLAKIGVYTSIQKHEEKNYNVIYKMRDGKETVGEGDISYFWSRVLVIQKVSDHTDKFYHLTIEGDEGYIVDNVMVGGGPP